MVVGRPQRGLEATPSQPSSFLPIPRKLGLPPSLIFQPSQAAGQSEVVQPMPGIPLPQELGYIHPSIPHYMTRATTYILRYYLTYIRAVQRAGEQAGLLKR